MTREWIIEDHGDRPLTVNKVASLHRMAWAKHTADVRRTWWILGLEAKVPALDRCEITVVPLHKDRRSPQDVAACSPSSKAAIDGLIDAGVLPDDGPEYLLRVTFLPPDVCGVDGMRLIVREAL